METQLNPSPFSETHAQSHSVNRLQLTHFRNHAYTELEVGNCCVVLYGENGAGKTNILEAISLLAPGRGFRRAKLSEMDGDQPWTVFAEANGSIGEVSIGTAREADSQTPLAGDQGRGFFDSGVLAESPPLAPPASGVGIRNRDSGVGIRNKDSGVGRNEDGGVGLGERINGVGVRESSDRRIVRVDGQALKSANQLSEYLSILWLTPQSDQLFLEGGTARRKFLDRLVYGFDAAHARRVNRFELAMRERNRLLGNYNADPFWFEGIELQMAEIGASIAFARQQSIEHINAVMQLSNLSFPKAQLNISGDIEEAVKQGMSSSEVERFYRQLLVESRGRDKQSGRTSVGVHRAQFEVMHLGKGTEAARCSTGEQKALLLAIILAEARASALWHERVPVILLDEVAAHLDPRKRAELYREIQSLKVQAWMSGVSLDLFKEMHDNVCVFRVEQGRILKE